MSIVAHKHILPLDTIEKKHIVENYLPYQVLPFIENFKAVWTKNTREKYQWEALAIHFKNNLSQEELIRAITLLKATNFIGFSEETPQSIQFIMPEQIPPKYHIFYFD